MTDAERQALATRLGLDPATASEADIHAAALTPEAPIVGGNEDGSTTTTTDPAAETVETGELVTARTTTISRERLAELEANASAGATARAEQVAAQRTAAVSAALADGRITPAEAGLTPNQDGTWPEGWRADFDQWPEATAAALGRLEAGKYPGAQARGGVIPNANATATARTDAVLASIPGASGATTDRKVTHR